MDSVGIGITTFGARPGTSRCIEGIIELAPAGTKIYIAKDVAGIAKAKNICFKNLDECEHIFLFDDDTTPLKVNWHLPYIQSREPHLSYTFGRKVLKTENGIVYYELPNGCMLYINKRCLEKVGGFDEGFQVWGYEHVDYSRRVFNAGLTSSPFMDVEGSEKLIYSLDRKHEIKSTVAPRVRRRFISVNKKRYLQQKDSKEFMPYK